ncbi:MAG: hypothetical protein HY815_31060 [Candidatus Riflebacteria bacterium]|nr:hypothetical protein [Candidatus Riflebacteria bacterium]
MPSALAICIEDLEARSCGQRYLQCVALPGRQAGLKLDSTGTVHWQTDEPIACELWVSADDQLVLFRTTGAAPITVHRGGRSLAAPFEKPVILLDQDELSVPDRKLRIHVHGAATVIAPPSWLSEASLKHLARVAAAALAIGAAAGCGEITVRQTPPSPRVPSPPSVAGTPGPTGSPGATPSGSGPASPAGGGARAAPSPADIAPIEVRDHPPKRAWRR